MTETIKKPAMNIQLHSVLPRLRPALGHAPALLLCLGLLLGSTTTPRAAIRVVTNAADDEPGSLRDQVAAAASGDTLTFDPDLNGQTLSLVGMQLVIDKSLTILGPGPGLLSIEMRPQTPTGMRVFKITANSSPIRVTIAGLTITGGLILYELPGDNQGGGGIFNDGASLAVSNCVLRDNKMAYTYGDAGEHIFMGSGGGAICNRRGTLQVIQCTLTHNEAYGGFSHIPGVGGAIYNQEGVVTIADSVISHNLAWGTGGAQGGGLVNRNGQMTLHQCILVGNKVDKGSYESSNGSDYGGAIASHTWGTFDPGATSLTVTGCTFLENTAAKAGGAIASESGSVTVHSSLFIGNAARVPDYNEPSAYSVGGGIFAWDSDLTVANSTFSSNSAGFAGGGIYFDGVDPTGGKPLSLNNSTFIGNTLAAVDTSHPEYGGGALMILNSSPARMSHCTLSGNTAMGGGGGIQFNDGGVRSSMLILNNSIVAGNTTGGAGLDIQTRVTGTDPKLVSNGRNFIGTTFGISPPPLDFTDMTFANTGTTLGQWLATDALGKPMLADHGGPTPTVALASGSPAIDAGANTDAAAFAYDQRGPGFPRVTQGKAGTAGPVVDIGAFEAPSIPVTTSPKPIGPGRRGSGRVRGNIIDVNAERAHGH